MMYIDSLVLYLDFLGFTDTIKQSEFDENQVPNIAYMLDEVFRIAVAVNKKGDGNVAFFAHAFSDSVIVSCQTISRETFVFMAKVVALLQFAATRRNYFIRGALSFGGHYEKEGVAFGPAFIRAFELEKQSVWPRVVIDPLVFNRLPADVMELALECYVFRGDDGLCYFDYLGQYLKGRVNGLATKEDLLNFDATGVFREHKLSVESTVEAIIKAGKTHLLSKYHSVAKYHNLSLSESIDFLGKDSYDSKDDPSTPKVEIAKVLKVLQEIGPSTLASTLRQERLKQCEINIESVFWPLYPQSKLENSTPPT